MEGKSELQLKRLEEAEESDIEEKDIEENDAEEKDTENELQSITLNLDEYIKNLWSLFLNGKIEMDESEVVNFTSILHGLEKIAQTYKPDELMSINDLGTKIENTNYYQAAKEMIESIKLSSAYTVELHFDDKGKLQKDCKIIIRHGGKQNRHVTPVSLIKHMIKQALQEGFKPLKIIEILLSKVELFRPHINEIQNNYIQAVFDYFKPQSMRSYNGIAKLIRVVLHFYHHILYLTMTDDYIKIPYKTNDCYVVPTLDFGGKVRMHKKEHTFISALLKILRGFENKLVQKIDLTEQEISQMTYSITAMFDFLPLPDDAVELKLPVNTSKHRYVGEPIERLGSLVTGHLLFVFDTYPIISERYRNEIIDGFISYVVEGVTEQKLCKTLGIQGLSELVSLINDNNDEYAKINLKYIKTNFTNVGKNKGFSQQYGISVQECTEILKKNVMKISKKRDFFYINVEEAIKDYEDDVSELKANIDSYMIDILFKTYLYNTDMNHDFEKFSLLNLNLKYFNKIFQNEFYKLLTAEFEEYTSDLSKTNLNKFFDNVFKSQDPIARNKLLEITYEAITKTYYGNFEFKEEENTSRETLLKELTEIRAKINKEANTSFESGSDVSFKLNETVSSSERRELNLSKIFPLSPDYNAIVTTSKSEESGDDFGPIDWDFGSKYSGSEGETKVKSKLDILGSGSENEEELAVKHYQKK